MEARPIVRSRVSRAHPFVSRLKASAFFRPGRFLQNEPKMDLLAAALLDKALPV